MKFSKNDPNLAMTLIGVCGHDDEAQTDVIKKEDGKPVAVSSKQKNEEFKKSEAEYQKQIDDLQTQIEKLKFEVLSEGVTPDVINEDKQTIYEYKLELKVLKKDLLNIEMGKLLTEPKNKLSCPLASSPFYLSEGLGRGVDISGKLKEEIATVQAPTKGASSIPSKYYHVIGSAYMACRMKQKGTSDFASTRIAEVGAWGYRATRLVVAKTAALASLHEADSNIVRDTGKPATEADYIKYFKKYAYNGNDEQVGKKELTRIDSYVLFDQIFFKNKKAFGIDLESTSYNPLKILSLTGEIGKLREKLEKNKDTDIVNPG